MMMMQGLRLRVGAGKTRSAKDLAMAQRLSVVSPPVAAGPGRCNFSS
jgi:hypothetical protein